MKAQNYGSSDYLKTQDDIYHYIDAALEDGHPKVLLEALKNVAKAKGGMANLAKETGLNRESLYKALSQDGNPRYETLTTIIKAMGFRLSVSPLDSAA